MGHFYAGEHTIFETRKCQYLLAMAVSTFACFLLQHCVALKEKCPSETQAFEQWVPVSSAVWEGVAGALLLEEACYRGQL